MSEKTLKFSVEKSSITLILYKFLDAVIDQHGSMPNIDFLIQDVSVFQKQNITKPAAHDQVLAQYFENNKEIIDEIEKLRIFLPPNQAIR